MINIAVIGTSTISTRFIEAVRMAGGLTVTTVFSRDPARAVAFAEKQGVPQTCSEFADLLASDIDAVYVGSPNGAHGEQVAAAIDAGKHVFAEKPVVPTAAEFAGLCERAVTRGVVLFEGMRNVYDPGFAALRDLLPQVGVLRRAAFSYCQRSARYDLVLAGERVNIFDPALAGGALLDLGVYSIAAMVDLFGEPESVASMSVPIPGGADGSGVALLRYPGFIGEVEYSKISRSDRPSEIQGETATLAIDRIEQPRKLTLTGLDGSVEVYAPEGAENNMVYEVRRFADLIAGQDVATSDNARTAATLRVVDAITAARRYSQA